jgi:hypothetical protein
MPSGEQRLGVGVGEHAKDALLVRTHVLPF